MRLPLLRPYGVVFHRWAGWVLAIVLTVLGLTGSLLAFYEPLDRIAAPHLRVVTAPHPGAGMIDPIDLRAQVLARHPQRRVDRLGLDQPPGQAARFRVPPLPGATGEPAYDEVFVDPYTGRELGHRLWGDIGQGRVNLMTFVYRLHYSLAMGEAGVLLLGMLALLWTIDCFVGAWLSFPARPAQRADATRQAGRSWWSRWRPAWRLRWSAGGYKLHFDLHRAGGLWLWALLFVIAWSGVAFNLQGVYKPVMGALQLPYVDAQEALPARPPLDSEPSTAQWRGALEQGRALLNDFARHEGLAVQRLEALSLSRETRTWQLDAMTSRDVSGQHGATRLYFDVDTGRLLATELPSGRFAGNTVTSWLLALHTAQVGGTAFRLVVCLTGLGVVSLCVTGLVIWWNKRRGRRLSARHRSAARAA